MKILHVEVLGSHTHKEVYDKNGAPYEFVTHSIPSPDLGEILTLIQDNAFDGAVIERNGFEEWCRTLKQSELGDNFFLSQFGDVIVIALRQDDSIFMRTYEDFGDVPPEKLDSLFGQWD